VPAYFTHTLCSLLSAIIKIAEPPSRHLEKKPQQNNTQPRLTPRGRLLEYCVDSPHIAAHRATISSSRTTFKFLLFLGPLSYIIQGDATMSSQYFILLQYYSICFGRSLHPSSGVQETVVTATDIGHISGELGGVKSKNL
jgi:hypothetical protein